MKILFLCKEFPYEKVIGGLTLVYNHIKILSKSHEVSLMCFIKEHEKKYLDSVKSIVADLTVIDFPKKRSLFRKTFDFLFTSKPHYLFPDHHCNEFKESLDKKIQNNNLDTIIADFSVIGQYLFNNPITKHIPKVIRVHESYYFARLKSFKKFGFSFAGFKELLNLKGLKKYEFSMYKSYDRVVTLTKEDKDRLLSISPTLNIDVVPHGVDIDYFSYDEFSPKEPSIMFLGNYPHFPNADAVHYFHEDVWPELKKKIPLIKFYIVGKDPTPEISALASDDIIVTGTVPDVRPYLKKASIFVCPVRLGSGFRGKVLEAMAMGRPVVSTKLGANGIPSQNSENIFIADNSEDFVNNIISLINDRELYNKISINARKLIEKNYSWESGAKRLEEVLLNVIKEKGG